MFNVPDLKRADAPSLKAQATPNKKLTHQTKLKAKFHYAIWSQTGSKLVADLQLVLDDRPNFCSLQVCDQLRT